MKENTAIIYSIFETMAGLMYFVPGLIVLLNKKVQTSFFIVFACYWTWCGLVNLVGWIGLIENPAHADIFDRVFNIIDTPIMMYILYRTTTIGVIKRHISKILLYFLSCSALLLLLTKMHPVTENFVVGVGVVIVLAYLCWIVYEHTSAVKPVGATPGKQFIYYTLIFEYGTSLIIFVFCYLVTLSEKAFQDVRLLFHFSVIVSICIATLGFVYHRKEAPVKLRQIKSKRDGGSEIRYL